MAKSQSASIFSSSSLLTQLGQLYASASMAGLGAMGGA